MNWTANDIERLKNKGLTISRPVVKNTVNNIPKNIPGQLEDAVQRQCFAWFKFQYPAYHHRIFHIPNGGKRDKKTYVNKKNKTVTYSPTAKKLKDQGALAGVWDIFLSVPKFGFSGMFIEMKAGKNSLTDSQKEFREANDRDYLFKVCYSLAEFKTEFDKYLK